MRNKIIFAIVISLVLVFALVGCVAQEQQDKEEEVRVVSISVDQSSVPSTAYAGEFDVSALRLNVQYSDSTVKTIGMNADMVETSSRDKLSKVGTQMIRIVYSNCRTSFQITLLEKEKKQYTLKIYGGKPIAINDVAIEEDIEIVGEYFEAKYDEGTVVTIEWIPVDGYSFNEWTDGNNAQFKDTQSITKATMNMNHTYYASGSPAVMTVNFETNCSVSVGSKKTDILYESDIIELSKEGYVFDGWTTERLIGEEAIDSDAVKIVFPYTVTVNNCTLYGTWRRLGLEYVTYTNEVTGNTGYKVTGYGKNDKELAIPASYGGFNVIAIDGDALRNATKLEKLVLPATLEEIGDGFVRNCALLEEIELAIGSRYFSVSDGALYNYNMDEIIAYPAGKITSGYRLDGVKVVHDYAFYNALTGGITLSSSLRTIGNYAFYSNHIDYVDMLAVNPTETGFRVGSDLFNENISGIVVSGAFLSTFKNFSSIARFESAFTTDLSTVPDIGVNDAGTILYKVIINENSDSDFGGTSVEIIGVKRTTTNLIIPITLGNYDVSSIGVKAFNGCTYLTGITIPSESKLERILEGAFDETPYLNNLTSKTIMANGVLYKYLGNESVFVLPPAVSRIAESAFYNNKNLVRLDLSQNNKLRYIGPYAFYGCSSFVGTVDDTEKGFYAKRDLQRVANYAFAYSGITAFGVPPETSSLVSVGTEAFSNCYYLKEISLGVNTSDIRNNAFLYCYSLQSFSVPDGNKFFVSVDGVLFASTVEGEKINTLFAYPSGKMLAVYDIEKSVDGYQGSREFNVTLIGDYAFFMSNIAALVLPESVANISSQAIRIPGLVYVKFAKINDGIAFDDLFLTGADDYPKFTPEYIVASADDGNLNVFFNNNAVDKAKYHKESADTVFREDSDGNVILRITDDSENKCATVIKTSRVASAIEIGDGCEIDSTIYSITVIGEYAFMGNYLEKLTLGKRINQMERASVKYASNLTKLYLAPDGAVPAIDEETFGDKFDNGMFIYVSQDKISSLKDSWKLTSDRFVIDLTAGYPAAGFGYKSGEDPDAGTGPVGTVTGEITQEWVDMHVPTREGYSFEGWCDENDNVIDFTTPYVIPYNITLVCKWKPATFTVVFNLENKAVFEGERTVSVSYGDIYAFGSPIYSDGSKRFLYWKASDGTKIDSNGTWIYSDKGSVINLYAVWKEKQFTLIYDLPAEGKESAIVEYDKQFTLGIPEKDGFTFMGWAMDPDGNEMLTNANGDSLLCWEKTDKEEYDIYSVWEAKQIAVTLYFTEGVKFKTFLQLYGEDFYFPYTGVSDEQWAKKADVFCGWYSNYDSVNNSGTGTRYTDEAGNGLFKWDVASETSLYAQWPLEISTGEQLESLEDLSRSVMLTGDITVTKPIGGKDSPYTGTFIGNGHTVTFDYTVTEETEFDGFVGLFARNGGTIKNIKLNSTINIHSTAKLRGGELYVGAIAGKNEGKIINTTKSDAADVTATIKVATTTEITNAYIGGYTGYNHNGTIKNISMNFMELSVSVNGINFNPDVHSDKFACGTVVGCINGGSVGPAADDPDKANVNETFVYYYTADTDSFKNLTCGKNLTNTAVNVGVSTSKKSV